MWTHPSALLSTVSIYILSISETRFVSFNWRISLLTLDQANSPGGGLSFLLSTVNSSFLQDVWQYLDTSPRCVSLSVSEFLCVLIQVKLWCQQPRGHSTSHHCDTSPCFRYLKSSSLPSFVLNNWEHFKQHLFTNYNWNGLAWCHRNISNDLFKAMSWVDLSQKKNHFIIKRFSKEDSV